MNEEFGIKKADPPSAGKSGRAISPRNEAIREMLMNHPGDWFLVAQGEKHDGLAVAIRRGKGASFREGIWEARVRAGEHGGKDVYARYVGPSK